MSNDIIGQLASANDIIRDLRFRITNVTTEKDVANQEIERLSSDADKLLCIKEGELTAANAKVEELRDAITEALQYPNDWNAELTLKQALADTEAKG